MKIFFLDLDGTLADLPTGSDWIADRIAEKLGIDQSNARTWRTELSRGELGLTMERYAQKIVDHCPETGTRESITAALNALFQQGNAFLPWTIELLNGLRARADYLVLVTHGDEGFQRWKIEQLGIGSYFHEAFFLSPKKDKSLPIISVMERFTDAKGYCIDDKLSVVEAVTAATSHLPLQVLRAGHLQITDPRLHTLQDLLWYTED